MKRLIRPIVICVLVFFILSCGTVPITGRRQLNLIPAGTMLSMSFQQYDEFLKTHQLSDNSRQTAMVKRAGERISRAVERYFAQRGESERLRNYAWEFNLVEDEAVNAWCMPGGKVVVYTGILPVAENETGLAVVMGHEIAHAVARHGNERMTQGLMVQMGGLALSTALQKYPERTQQLWMQAFGLGAQVGVLLPYSRTHETEADRLGLIFMALAGYNPQAAVGFWQRMTQASGGQAPPEFLSTHPAGETRIRQIRAALPEAMRYYRQ